MSFDWSNLFAGLQSFLDSIWAILQQLLEAIFGELPQ